MMDVASEPKSETQGAQQLRHLTKTDTDPRVRRRAQALLVVADGETLAGAARLFHTSAYRIRVWQTRFAAEGRDGLVDRPRGGRPTKLSPDDLKFLEEALDAGPQAYELPMTIWSIRDLQALLKRERQVEISVYTMHRVVHDLGFCYRRPRHDLTHRQDAQAVAAAQRVLEWLPKKRLIQATDPLLSDSIWSTWTNVKSIPIPTRAMVWRRKGQPMKVPAAGEDQKFTVFGGVDYASGQVLWQTSERKGEVAFMAFLEHLAATLPTDEPVVVVLDNVGYHKSHALREVWRRYSGRLQPFFLPAYSPQLNLIERLWRYVKQRLACHRWWNRLDRLIQATEVLLANLEAHFHATNGPTFRPAQNFCQSA